MPVRSTAPVSSTRRSGWLLKNSSNGCDRTSSIRLSALSPLFARRPSPRCFAIAMITAVTSGVAASMR
jgi:hypothetical protein